MNEFSPARTSLKLIRNVILLLLTVLLVVWVRPAFSETFYGFLYEGGNGAILEDFTGNFYFVEGPGVDEFLNMEVIIEGELHETGDGELMIRVFDIRQDERFEMPEDALVSMNFNYQGH